MVIQKINVEFVEKRSKASKWRERCNEKEVSLEKLLPNLEAPES